ncbi:hypothetical protein VPH35_054782 [Triticum aestivum]
MADAQPNSGGLAVDPPGMAKKKKGKAPRKPRSECTPEEIAKLDAESAKRRSRRAVAKTNIAAAKRAAERAAIEAARHKAEVEEKEAIAFQSLEAFKARHNDKSFTLTHCWTMINNCPKFKDQYGELQRKRGLKTSKFAGGGDGEALKRPRGKTNSKVDDMRDASSMALHDTLHGMMSQKDVRDEKKRQSKDEQMKQYLELQTKKLEMEEAAKRRKLEMSEKTRAWFEARQKEMLDTNGLN